MLRFKHVAGPVTCGYMAYSASVVTAADLCKVNNDLCCAAVHLIVRWSRSLDSPHLIMIICADGSSPEDYAWLDGSGSPGSDYREMWSENCPRQNVVGSKQCLALYAHKSLRHGFCNVACDLKWWFTCRVRLPGKTTLHLTFQHTFKCMHEQHLS